MQGIMADIITITARRTSSHAVTGAGRAFPKPLQTRLAPLILFTGPSLGGMTVAMPATVSDLPEPYRQPNTARHIALIAESHERLTGRPLVAPSDDPVLALWQAPQVVVAHGTEADPLFFFANRAALNRFETTVENFVASPSRLSAEAPLREERQGLLDRVTKNGFISDYSGVRISALGRRFRIEQATVWNLTDKTGKAHGQAPAFDTWTELDNA